MASSSSTFRRLRKSWLSFVRHELTKLGMSSWLPSSPSSCFCRRSWISYPHWPPSIYQEALEQLSCILRKNNDHRKYLASCWLSFINRKAFWDPLQISVQDISDLIESSCPVFLEGGRNEELDGLRRQAVIDYRKVFSCSAFCNPVLQERRFDCLCHCGRHREECPVHGNR
jgi:hypothetical protein